MFSRRRRHTSFAIVSWARRCVYETGPLALVQDGDMIELDTANRALTLHVSEEELATRRAVWTPPEKRFSRGYGKLFEEEITQANEGCDFKFLHNDGSCTPEPGIH